MGLKHSSTLKHGAAAATLALIAREIVGSKGAAPVDTRPRCVKVITKELGLSLDAIAEEAFYVEAAHKARLTGRQLDHLMREYTELFVSRIRKARLSARARRALKRYPPVTAEHFRLSLANAVKVAKALGGKLVV
jgi:hypothetical protein